MNGSQGVVRLHPAVVRVPAALCFLDLMTAGIAGETNRAPFDFLEAEQELVAGYHTEYSSMSFAMFFFLADIINMVTVSAVATDLFPRRLVRAFLPVSLGWIWFLIGRFRRSSLRVDAVDVPRVPPWPASMAFGWCAAAGLGDQPARDGGWSALFCL